MVKQQKTKRIYNYLIKSHLDELVVTMRYHYNPQEKVIMFLDNKTGMFIEDYVPYAYANALIFNILDSFNIFDKRENFVFYESFQKGRSYEYMSKVKDTLFELNIKDEVILIPHILGQIKDVFFLMSSIMDHIVHLDHSFDDYLDAYGESEEFREMLHHPKMDPEHMDPYTLRDELEKIPKMFTNKINIRPIQRLMTSGVKVNHKQILQNFRWGFVPDKLHPQLMEDTFVMEGCMTGYLSKESIFIDGNIGRTAMINSKLETKDTGALSKIVGSVLMNATLNAPKTRKVIHDCGTKLTRTVKINSEKDLKYYRYVYYLKPDGTYDYIDLDRKFLIGKTIQIRSIALCEGEHVCEMCFGRLAKFNQDTDVTKLNFGILILVALAAILQGVISIKHSISGMLQDIYVQYNGERLHYRDFVNKYKGSLIMNVGYNKIKISKKFDIVFAKDGKHIDVFSKGNMIKLENSNFIKLVEEDEESYTFMITLPNKSVLTRADDLQLALRKHHRSPEFKEGWSEGKTYIEKVDYIIDFFNKYIGFSHNVYAESLAYCLIRDSEDKSKRPNKDSKDITLIKVQDVIEHPEYSNNISSTIPYGFVEKQLMHIKQSLLKGNNQDYQDIYSDYDILYMSKDSKKEPSPYLKLDEMLQTLTDLTNVDE